MEVDVMAKCDEARGDDYRNAISFERKTKLSAVRYAGHSEQDEKGSTKTTE